MQDFTIFDMVIVSITVLLGLKGLFRGFIKEVFGLVGIVGGLFVASRVAVEIGKIIAPILALENSATIKVIGFVLGLVGFWAVIYVLGVILSKIFAASGLGIFDRILGFVFGSAKIFLIFSVIAYALYQVNSFKDLMDKKFATATVFPLLIQTGGFIVKLDTSDFTNAVEKAIPKSEEIEEDPDLIKERTFVEEVKDTVKQIKESTMKSGTTVVKEVKKVIEENVGTVTKELNNNINTPMSKTSEDAKKEAEKMINEMNRGN
jgi:membrane protein required for colicin V production